MEVQHTGDETGEDEDYIHMRIQGNQVETLRVIKGDTQTRHGRKGNFSETRREVSIQNKTESDKTKYKN